MYCDQKSCMFLYYVVSIGSKEVVCYLLDYVFLEIFDVVEENGEICLYQVVVLGQCIICYYIVEVGVFFMKIDLQGDIFWQCVEKV